MEQTQFEMIIQAIKAIKEVSDGQLRLEQGQRSLEQGQRSLEQQFKEFQEQNAREHAELKGELKRVEDKFDTFQENIIDHMGNKFGKYDFEISTIKKAIANK